MTAAESTDNRRPDHVGADVDTIEPDDLTTDLGAADLAALPEATPRQLFWRAFTKHKLALLSLILIVLVYLVVIFAEFLAPSTAEHVRSAYALAPPQVVHFFGQDANGHQVLMYVYGYSSTVDPQTNAINYTADHSQLIPVRFFADGDQYRLFGLFPMNHHLIGPVDANQPFFLLGSDVNGRDLLSRVIFGARISMSIGLVGVAIAFVLGIVLGGLSGYFGGRIDTVIQRLIELLMSIPTLPLWLALAAAMPLSWGAVSRYFAITVILAIVAWTGLARVVRGRFLALRGEEYVMAAQLDGNSVWRTTMRHMLPAFNSHLIAQLTLSVPAMIIAETSLSFLGLGLTPPAVSWGVLLQAASSIQVISSAPWLLIPGLAVVITVLALNFLGDGLRDAADPYGH
ncbi:ABC transporter permease [Microlunatus soli]|uniref:Peptide/nickel transport system permease protein n=1 Tax=Microlunatus soli TaxID=630515 RepID=A0A1H1QJR4_9ACTN|nr:ABC transporter permease [Microlunatus soli]SDS23577.1 peptide/nickel transport system permease protein [Microlunatus soli]